MPFNIQPEERQAIAAVRTLTPVALEELVSALKTAPPISSAQEMAAHIAQQLDAFPADRLLPVLKTVYTLYRIRDLSGVNSNTFLDDLMTSVTASSKSAQNGITKLRSMLDRLLSIESVETAIKASRLSANHPLPRGSKVATELAHVSATRRRRPEPDLCREFSESAEKWKDETGRLSSLTKALAHPSYLRIIGLAGHSTDHKLEKLLLEELRKEPDHWFAALTAITGEDPIRPEDDFDTAVERWLAWGCAKGYIVIEKPDKPRVRS